MMNRKEATPSLAIVGMALSTVVVMVAAMSLSTEAIALGHWNLDGDYTPNKGLEVDGVKTSSNTDIINADEDLITTVIDDGSSDGNNGEDMTYSESVAYEEFQRCVSDGERDNEFLTEQEMQGCYESNFGEDSTSHAPTDEEDKEDEE